MFCLTTLGPAMANDTGLGTAQDNLRLAVGAIGAWLSDPDGSQKSAARYCAEVEREGGEAALAGLTLGLVSAGGWLLSSYAEECGRDRHGILSGMVTTVELFGRRDRLTDHDPRADRDPEPGGI